MQGNRKNGAASRADDRHERVARVVRESVVRLEDHHILHHDSPTGEIEHGNHYSRKY